MLCRVSQPILNKEELLTPSPWRRWSALPELAIFILRLCSCFLSISSSTDPLPQQRADSCPLFLLVSHTLGTRPSLPFRPRPASVLPASSGFQPPRPSSRGVLAGLRPECSPPHTLSHCCQACLSKPQLSVLPTCSENFVVISGNRSGLSQPDPDYGPVSWQPLSHMPKETCTALGVLRPPVCVYAARSPERPSCPAWAQGSSAQTFAGPFLLTLLSGRSKCHPALRAPVALLWLSAPLSLSAAQASLLRSMAMSQHP